MMIKETYWSFPLSIFSVAYLPTERILWAYLSKLDSLGFGLLAVRKINATLPIS